MAARLLDKFKRVLPFALLLVYLAQFTAFIIGSGGFEPFVRSTDFMPTMTAAQLITQGKGPFLYDLAVQHEVQEHILYPYRNLAADETLPYIHLPFEAFLLVPFMFLSYTRITLFWTLLLAIALGATLYLLQRTLPLRQPLLVMVVICAISYQPVFRAFFLGQNSPFVLLGICLIFAARRRDSTRWHLLAGFGLVLIALKPQILPLVLLLMAMDRQWPALFWFGFELVILTIICMPVLGIMWPIQYITMLQHLGVSSRIGIEPTIMHNWRGFAIDTVGTVSTASANILIVVMTALSILLFLYGSWSVQVQNRIEDQGQIRNFSNLLELQPDSNKELMSNLLWALGIVTAILISPHLNPHDLMLLIFPGWIMVSMVQNGKLSQNLSAIWLSLLKILYSVMAASVFFKPDSSFWVIMNVALLAFSTGLLMVTIKSSQQGQNSTCFLRYVLTLRHWKYLM